MRKIVLLIGFNFFAIYLIAQNNLTVSGNVVNEEKPLGGVLINVYKDSSILFQINTPKDGGFSINLEYDFESIITFSKEGYLTKKIFFSTFGVPEEYKSAGFEFPMQIGLLNTPQDKVLSTQFNLLLDKPIARIYYDSVNGYFDQDQKYQKDVSIDLKKLRELQKSLKEIEENPIYIQARQSIEKLISKNEISATQINILQKDKVIKDLEIKAKKNQQFAMFGGLFLVLVFAGFMYNRFRVTKKQKNIITQQKHLVEEKHKEITDSINYAERIQRSFLATTEMLDQHLKNYFVFFRPKDVVSGDFYWAGELNNGNFAFSVADSTGHGVPGAIMSILNISSLEKSIEHETAPDQILNKTRKIIIDRLKKDGSTEGGKDGMDCSLLVINQDRTQLSFAAANNPVFIVRNNELMEFKPDKMPVGKHDNDAESFTLHTALLQKGDVIYALTDGFPDQFGGDKGKKYMIKNLKELLLQIACLPMQEQEQKLAEEFDKWKGSNEQVDDVCIIGVRV